MFPSSTENVGGCEECLKLLNNEMQIFNIVVLGLVDKFIFKMSSAPPKAKVDDIFLP